MKNKERGIKVYHYKKSSNHKGRELELNKKIKELQRSQKHMNEMVTVSSYLSIITIYK